MLRFEPKPNLMHARQIFHHGVIAPTWYIFITLCYRVDCTNAYEPEKLSLVKHLNNGSLEVSLSFFPSSKPAPVAGFQGQPAARPRRWGRLVLSGLARDLLSLCARQ